MNFVDGGGEIQAACCEIKKKLCLAKIDFSQARLQAVLTEERRDCRQHRKKYITRCPHNAKFLMAEIDVLYLSNYISNAVLCYKYFPDMNAIR